MRHQLTSRGWLLAVAACVSCCAIEVETKPTSQDSDFSQPGPCSWTSWKATFSVPADIKGLGKTLPLTITQPTCGNSSGLSPPYPVVFFYSGFQVRQLS